MGDQHACRGGGDSDFWNFDTAIDPIWHVAICVQHGVVTDYQPSRLAHRNAMGMAVHDDIILDQNVLVEHLAPGQPLIDNLTTHEDGLGPVSLTNVEVVVPNDDVGARTICASGPKLDHVHMVG